MIESGQTPARYRVGLFAFAVLGLSTLSFVGALDKLAHDHAEEARNQALGAYATVSALNMGVSVLQTSELGVAVIGSVQIGQLLDPINDAAERASTALAWSIGSLFVQRILLGFASSSLVKWVFVASGLLALLALLPMPSTFGVSGAVLDRVRRASVRCFAIAGILRFLVPAFVAGSYLASQALLQEQLNEDQKAVSEMSGSFEMLNGSGAANGETLAQGLRDQIADLRHPAQARSGPRRASGDGSRIWCQRSHASWAVSQKPADTGNIFSRRSAVSGVTPCRPLTIAFSRRNDKPSARATLVCVSP